MLKTYTEKEYRQGFYYLINSIVQMVETMITMAEPQRSRDHILILSCRKKSLAIYAPCSYVKVLSMIPDRNHGTMQLDLMAYHDSCWREGVVNFTRILVDEKINHPQECGFQYILNVYRWVCLMDLAETTAKVIRNMDYNTGNVEYLQPKTIAFDQKLFPISSNSLFSGFQHA